MENDKEEGGVVLGCDGREGVKKRCRKPENNAFVSFSFVLGLHGYGVYVKGHDVAKKCWVERLCGACRARKK